MRSKSSMRLLVVMGYYKPAYIYGGPVKSVSDLCAGMAKAGAEVVVFATDANGKGKHLLLDNGRRQTVDGVEVHYYPVQWPLASVLPYYSSALAQACQREVKSYDVVYLPSTWTHSMWAGARAARAAGVPYVVSPRGSFMDWSLTQKALKKRAYLALFERRFVESAFAIHVTTELEARQQQKLGFRTPTKVIPNGIDMSRFESAEGCGDVRRVLQLSPDSLVSLFVGRLHDMKRVDLMIDAFARVAQANPKAHFVIAGPDQGCASELMRQRDQLGLTSRVHFLGLVEGPDLVGLYHHADLLLLVSHRENFGMVLVEAMASSLPVIVSNQVGLAEEIEAAGAGIVVSGGTDELVNAWTGLLSQGETRAAMGKRGRELVRASFAIERVSAEMLELFASAMAARPKN